MWDNACKTYPLLKITESVGCKYLNAKQKQSGCKICVRPIRSHNGYKRPKTLISSKARDNL